LAARVFADLKLPKLAVPADQIQLARSDLVNHCAFLVGAVIDAGDPAFVRSALLYAYLREPVAPGVLEATDEKVLKCRVWKELGRDPTPCSSLAYIPAVAAFLKGDPSASVCGDDD